MAPLTRHEVPALEGKGGRVCIGKGNLNPDRDIQVSSIKRVLDFIGWNDLVFSGNQEMRGAHFS